MKEEDDGEEEEKEGNEKKEGEEEKEDRASSPASYEFVRVFCFFFSLSRILYCRMYVVWVCLARTLVFILRWRHVIAPQVFVVCVLLLKLLLLLLLLLFAFNPPAVQRNKEGKIDGLLWFSVVWCGVVWRGVAWRGVAWRGVVVALFVTTTITY